MNSLSNMHCQFNKRVHTFVKSSKKFTLINRSDNFNGLTINFIKTIKKIAQMILFLGEMNLK